MDPIASAALAGLHDAVVSLLPAVAEPVLVPEVAVNATRIDAAGLGGFVGVSKDPPGDIFGRRVRAAVVVTARTTDGTALTDTVSAMTAAFVGADRSVLRGSGVLDVELSRLGDASVVESDGGDVFRRDVEFSVLYEHLQLPTEAEGVIDKIPLELDVGALAPPRALLRALFASDPLGMFEVVDDPAATNDGPSAWGYNAAERRVEQSSSIWGGTNTLGPRKPGTYLVLRTTPTLPPARDFVLRAELASDDVHGIGVVFRWHDVNAFYYFLLHSEGNFRILAKSLEDSFASLTPAAEVTEGFTPGETLRVRVEARGPEFEVFVNDRRVLTAADTSISAAGRVGFMCHRNHQARFYGLDLVGL
jgi:hypothetical protein